MDEDELKDEVFICMDCGKKCNVTEGTWPEYYKDVPVDIDDNTRATHEFVCYDCCN